MGIYKVEFDPIQITKYKKEYSMKNLLIEYQNVRGWLNNWFSLK